MSKQRILKWLPGNFREGDVVKVLRDPSMEFPGWEGTTGIAYESQEKGMILVKSCDRNGGECDFMPDELEKVESSASYQPPFQMGGGWQYIVTKDGKSDIFGPFNSREEAEADMQKRREVP